MLTILKAPQFESKYDSMCIGYDPSLVLKDCGARISGFNDFLQVRSSLCEAMHRKNHAIEAEEGRW